MGRKARAYLWGQPAIIYRGEIEAKIGKQSVPQLFGQSLPYLPEDETVKPLKDKMTTARNIFKQIHIRVIKPPPGS